jgi:hypothetical protein
MIWTPCADCSKACERRSGSVEHVFGKELDVTRVPAGQPEPGKARGFARVRSLPEHFAVDTYRDFPTFAGQESYFWRVRIVLLEDAGLKPGG